MSTISVPVSYGELLDKITILEIKAERIDDPEKNANVRRELTLLSDVWKNVPGGDQVGDQHQALKVVNEKLWDIEDRIRLKEKAQAFDQEFIDLARAVYVTNDERAAVKKALNLALGSELVEEKSYQPY